jgi:hypothetical protein
VGGFAAAWLTGTGIVAWREVKTSGHMPVPAALLGVTLLFVGLDVVATVFPRSRPLVTMGAWGLNVAGLLQLLGPANGLYGQVAKTEAAEGSAEGEAAPS